MVGSSSVPFSVLVVPQVLRNIGYMASGNMSALSVISWEGYLSGLLGNTLMCSHFANSGERSAMVVQLVGIANNLTILLQVTLASCMPTPVFLAVLVSVSVAVAMSVARLTGRIPAIAPTGGGAAAPPMPTSRSSSSRQDGSLAEADPADAAGALGAWQLWQLVSGILGLAVVPQVLFKVLYPGNPSWLPGLLTLGVLTLWFTLPVRVPDQASLAELTNSQHEKAAPGAPCQDKCKANRRGAASPRTGLGPSVEQLPGWASTLLFALSPLPQLVRNFLDPQSLEGLSVGTMLLALLGNALMVPRALFIRDPVWMLGTTWACCAGWGQLFSMFIRNSPATGERYVAAPIFAGVSLALSAYTLFVSWATHTAAAPAA